MSDPAFFGYGSLVNLSTHAYSDPRPARLTGWRRIWQSTSLRDTAFLSVLPDPTCTIDGVIARVPGADWAALDEREFAYQRQNVTVRLVHDGASSQSAVYQVDPDLHVATQHPILLSYLDVVVQGFLQMFGTDGVAAFFATTGGWGPVMDDRHAPIYPRHRQLTKGETALVDQYLSDMDIA